MCPIMLSNPESLLLDKLQHMVPIMPRDRALSELEIINYVIEYIRKLRAMVVEDQEQGQGLHQQ